MRACAPSAASKWGARVSTATSRSCGSAAPMARSPSSPSTTIPGSRPFPDPEAARRTDHEEIAMVVNNFIFIGLLLLGAIAFAIAPLVVVWVVAPRKQSLAKSDIYECGVRTTGETWVRFRIQYYIYALMFVVFDIETVFLFPWAASYAGLGTFALVEMVVFLLILLVGLVYAWAKGVLRWV